MADIKQAAKWMQEGKRVKRYTMRGGVRKEDPQGLYNYHADYDALERVAVALRDQLQKEVDSTNCICKMLGYIGEEPPCRTCQMKAVLAQASLLERKTP